jgi:hypothetical protein
MNTLGNIGGSNDAVVVSHNHDVTDPKHGHTVTGNFISGGNGPYGNDPNGVATESSLGTSSELTGISIDNEGVDGTNKNLPPYMALYWVIRIQ